MFLKASEETLFHVMTWAWNTNALKVTAELNTWRTFFPNSFAFILSLVTWDSAISALSLASFNSCCCFLYLERYWLASASYKNKKWNKSLSRYNHIFFFCPDVRKLKNVRKESKLLSVEWNTIFLYDVYGFRLPSRHQIHFITFFPLEIENIVGIFHQ